MKTFTLTLLAIVLTGSFMTIEEKPKEQLTYEQQTKRVDSMIIVVDKLDAQLTQINK